VTERTQIVNSYINVTPQPELFVIHDVISVCW